MRDVLAFRMPLDSLLNSKEVPTDAHYSHAHVGCHAAARRRAHQRAASSYGIATDSQTTRSTMEVG